MHGGSTELLSRGCASINQSTTSFGPDSVTEPLDHAWGDPSRCSTLRSGPSPATRTAPPAPEPYNLNNLANLYMNLSSDSDTAVGDLSFE